MPQGELAVQLTEILETVVLEENARIKEESEKYATLFNKYSKLERTDAKLRKMYEQEIDTINRKWQSDKSSLNHTIEKL
jgi:hypothetical protein